MEKNYNIRIPNDITVSYFPKRSLILFIGPFGTESLKLDVRLFISMSIISVTRQSALKISNKKKKKLKHMQITSIALVKQSLIKVSYILYKKFNLVGVGYKVFETLSSCKEKKWFTFKLGYSHLLYFRTQKQTNFFCLKFTTLFACGHSYTNLTQTCSDIRSYKMPDPYKGKGILYSDEKIILKEGKKV